MINVAINGFGRIGRVFLRALMERHSDLNIVAINDLSEPEILGHLLRHDSVFGKAQFEVTADSKSITVAGKKIPFLKEKDLNNLNWSKYDVDVVLESTGVFRTRAQAEIHIKNGAKKVLISAPPKDENIRQFIYGVNHKSFNSKQDSIFTIASCTTNSIVPVLYVLQKEFGIEKGFVTTIHSSTMDQNLLDAPHKDLRRARSALNNMIPTTTGAAKAVGAVIPELKGKLDGLAVRVPLPNGSVSDLSILLSKKTNPEEVNSVLEKYSKKELKGVMDVSTHEIVSSDIIADSHSSIVDAAQTKVVSGNLLKILAWYDNEYGFSCRLADMIKFTASK